MNKLKIFLLTICICMFVNSNAQDAQFDWVYGILKQSGYGLRSVDKLTHDSNGNIYVAGYFGATTQFDFLNQAHAVSSNGNLDCYVLKLSPTRNVLWLKTFGGNMQDRIADMFLHDDQFLYITGNFMNTMDIDPGPNVHTVSSIGQVNKSYILKLDTAGNYVWANEFGSKTSYDNPPYITADSQGNVYVAGGFRDTVDFNSGSGVNELISAGDTDAFIKKLDSDGNFIWVKQFGSTGRDFIKGISTDAHGNVYTIGHYIDTVDFDPGIGTHILASKGSVDGFIQKFDTNGNLIFAQSIGGIGSDRLNNLFVRDQYIYTTGMFYDTVDFDGSANIHNEEAALSNIFIHKLDTSGVLQMVKNIGGSGYDEGISIYADENHNIYLAGLFSSVVDFDTGQGTELVTAISQKDQFSLKLDSLGDLVWVYALPNSGSDVPSTIIVNDNEDVITGGSYSNSTNFNPGPGTGSGGLYVEYYSANGFIYQLKQCDISNTTEIVQSCGSYTWTNGITYHVSTNYPVQYLSNTLGCDSIVKLNLTITQATYGTDNVTSCDDYTWINGVTYTTSNNSAVDTLINSVGCDSIVHLNLTINNSISSTDTIVACQKYKWINGNTYFSSNYTATHTLTTVNGCDSLVSLNLTINNVNDLSVGFQDSVLFANNGGLNYQWLDCDNNMLPIWGGNQDTLHLSENGSYAVIIAENGCIDTSACITINDLSLTTNQINEFQYYPNPTNGKLNILINNPAVLSVFDITGRHIITPFKIIESHSIDLSENKPGVYIFQLNFKDEIRNFRVILN